MRIQENSSMLFKRSDLFVYIKFRSLPYSANLKFRRICLIFRNLGAAKRKAVANKVSEYEQNK